jgi:hypothetical protein
MTWTGKVVKGGSQKILQPRIMVYGTAGIGKSSFGATLPEPIFVDFDHGIDDVNVDRVPGPTTWKDSMEVVRSIASSPGKDKSLVIDTVDPLEEQAIEHVSTEAGKSFAKMNDDYGSGYVAVAAVWKLLLAELDIARQNGMLVCLLGHAVIRQASDPTLGNFDQFTSQLGKKSWAATQRWCDAVMFAGWDSALVDKKDDQRIIVTGKRLLFTVRGSGFEAKNRWSLEPKLPLDEWSAVAAGIEKHRRTAAVIEAKIAKMANIIGGDAPEKAAGFVKDARGDLNTLTAIESALQEKLDAPPTQTTLPETAQPLDQRPAIRARIMELAKQAGGDAPEKAMAFLQEAGEDLVGLLQIEDALKDKMKTINGGAHV